jgi:hypothetical protein
MNIISVDKNYLLYDKFQIIINFQKSENWGY